MLPKPQTNILILVHSVFARQEHIQFKGFQTDVQKPFRGAKVSMEEHKKHSREYSEQSYFWTIIYCNGK